MNNGKEPLTPDLLAELTALRSQVAQMPALAERCRRAEEALRVHEERDRLQDRSPPPRPRPREHAQDYRLLFKSAPIPLLERDASALQTYLEHLRATGVSNFEEYFKRHPQEVTRCLGLIVIVDYNEAFLQLLEVTDQQDFVSALAEVNGAEFLRMAEDAIIQIAENRIPEEKERTFYTVQGNTRHVLVKSLVLAGHEDTLARIITSVVDQTRNKQIETALRVSERRFREQANRDNLTGLHNQRYLYHSLEHLLATALATNQPLSLLFIDLDHFKHIVDTHGHLNGSTVIREVAQTIREALPTPAYAVAYAGDEFVVVLPGFDQQQALAQAVALQTHIHNRVYLAQQGGGVTLQASCGIATALDHASDVTGLLAAADQALFTVKRNGKGAIGLANV
jgi:diguanylate cyclase (GGDEF)-like protein